jgi:hypothetical protein
MLEAKAINRSWYTSFISLKGYVSREFILLKDNPGGGLGILFEDFPLLGVGSLLTIDVLGFDDGSKQGTAQATE